jgi:putative transposase
MPRLKGYRFPREVVAYAVWGYHRFALSTADVEDLVAERGVIVSRETIRLWVNRFGSHFAAFIRRDRTRPSDKWHMDEVVIPINGVKHWLWRAVDANGDTLDILVQTRRNAKARHALSGKADRSIWPTKGCHHRQAAQLHKVDRSPDTGCRSPGPQGLNNRIEGSHRPTRRREKIMGRCKSPRQAQRFLATHDQINIIFKPRRYRLTANSYRHARADAFSLWNDYARRMTV